MIPDEVVKIHLDGIFEHDPVFPSDATGGTLFIACADVMVSPFLVASQ